MAALYELSACFQSEVCPSFKFVGINGFLDAGKMFHIWPQHHEPVQKMIRLQPASGVIYAVSTNIRSSSARVVGLWRRCRAVSTNYMVRLFPEGARLELTVCFCHEHSCGSAVSVRFSCCFIEDIHGALKLASDTAFFAVPRTASRYSNYPF
jgi:hypothetical protein